MDVEMIVEVIPQLPQVILVWITFFFLFMLLKKLLYEPLSNFIDSRKEKIQLDIDEAKKANEEAEKLRLEYESRIAEAREESQKILAEARGRGEELKSDIIQEANEEAAVIKSRARKDIERERAAAFEGVKSDVGEMALLIASKIMEKEIDAESQNQLIDQFIDEVGNTPWQN